MGARVCEQIERRLQAWSKRADGVWAREWEQGGEVSVAPGLLKRLIGLIGIIEVLAAVASFIPRQHDVDFLAQLHPHIASTSPAISHVALGLHLMRWATGCVEC